MLNNLIEYFNLDTLVKCYFDNTRVINVLSKNGINDLYDLYKCNINQVIMSDACGAKSKDIIEEAYYYLIDLSKQNKSTEEIIKKYYYILDEFIIVSKKSDNEELRNQITFERFIEIYNEGGLSDRDKINCNMILNFLNVYDGNEPLDYISCETAKFKSYSDAYDFLNKTINSLKVEKADIYKKYNGIFTKKETLEAIGLEYGITRERIRQINKNTTFKIYNQLDRIFKKIENTFTSDYYIPHSNPMLKIYCEYLETKKIYEESEKFDTKIYSRNNQIFNIINKIEKELKEKGVYEEEVDKALLKLFSKKYTVVNNKILKNATLEQFVPHVIEKIGRPVNLNVQSDVDLIYKMLKDEYSITSNYEDARNIERVLGQNSILIDFRTYISANLQKRTDISEVLEYINENEVTNAQKIYSEFQKLWNDIEIYSHAGVYGYLKYYYPELYNYSGRSMVISKLGSETSWGGIVINLIKEKKEPVSYDEVVEMYSALSKTIWVMLESNFDDLILWGDNKYYCNSELKLKDEDISFITSFIYNKKIVDEKELFVYILNNKPYMLNDNYIDNEKQLNKYIKAYYDEIINYNSNTKSYYI